MPPLDFGWPNWGDLPTWGAFIGATIAVYFTWQALKIQRKRELALDAQELRFQAEKFACWVSTIDNEGKPLVSFVLVWHNTSDLPVYNCRVVIRDLVANKDIQRMEVGSVKPGERSRTLSHDAQKEIQLLKDKRPEQGGFRLFGVIVTFTDTRGNCWQRETNGVLKQVYV